MRTHPRQAHAFEYADKNNLAVTFKTFLPPEYKNRFSACKSKRELAKFILNAPHEQRTCQELLRDSKCWISTYWDIDYYTVEITNIAAIRKRIIEAFELVCTKVFKSRRNVHTCPLQVVGFKWNV